MTNMTKNLTVSSFRTPSFEKESRNRECQRGAIERTIRFFENIFNVLNMIKFNWSTQKRHRARARLTTSGDLAEDLKSTRDFKDRFINNAPCAREIRLRQSQRVFIRQQKKKRKQTRKSRSLLGQQHSAITEKVVGTSNDRQTGEPFLALKCLR